ncbi:DUF748 domain-containing protein [Thiomicrorhabdus sp. Milos-T2]|uniref:DUF748 domain-containing protein n=1 Tax=Thiomicrorhabdus sp. Milos-T2 TaxID=90814 RepID=UPI000494148D|nr:DUF748 domain-containing protein [Thiomicrorhabdus sp. Milos-T2]
MTSWVTHNRWKSGIIVLLIAFVLALPYLLQQFAQKALLDHAKPYGIEKVQLSKVNLDPLTASIQIHNLRLFNKTSSDKAVAEIGLLGVNLDLTALLKKRIWIQSLKFENANLPFELKQNQQLFMAGIPLTHPDSKPEDKPSGKNQFSYLPGLDNISFKQIQLSLKYHKKTTNLQIENLSLNELHAWNKEGFARLIIKSKLNQNLIKANLQLHLFSDAPKVVGTFQAKAIKLDEFKQFIPQIPWDFSGQLTSDITFTLAQTQQGITLYQQGKLALNKIKLQQQNNQQSTKLQASNIDWKGDLHLIQPTTKAKTQLSLNGQLTAKNLRANQLIKKDKLAYNTQLQTLNLKGNHQINLGKSLQIITTNNLTLNNLRLNESNLNQSNLNHKSPKSALNITLKQASIKGKAQINQGSETFISLVQKLNIKALEFTDPKNKVELKTDLAAKLNNRITLNKDHFTLSQKDNNELTLTHLSAQQAQWFTQLNQINWQGRFNLNNQPKLTIQSNGKVAINQFTLENSAKKRNIAGLNQLNIAELNIKNLQDIELNNIQLQNLSVTKNNKQPGLVDINNLQLSQAHFQERAKTKQLTLGHLAIKDSATHLTLTQNNHIKEVDKLLALIGEPAQKKTTSAAIDTAKVNGKAPINPTKKQDKAFNYSLASLELSGDNPVFINIEQTQPPLKRTLKINQLSLGKIASQAPHKASKFSVNIALDEFSKIRSKGEFTPLAPSKHFKAATHLNGLDLKDLSPLVEQKLGYQIESGQLNADFSTQIDNNKIKAKNDIQLNKFVLESVNDKKTQAIEEGFPIPLQAGLGLLQDKNDNISLSIPINGNLDNPDFKIQDVINTALGNALASASRSYLLLALQPFGAIALVGEYALEKGTNISLQAVDFAPGSKQLSPKMKIYLKKLKKLLAEREAIQIKLCEGASNIDRSALKKIALQANIKQQTDKNPNAKVVVPDITISDNDLIQLAKQRQSAIKRYLINLGASNKQLILCKPKISKDNKTSQVKLSI